MDTFRERSKGSYETDFRILEPGQVFPSLEARDRNRVYAFNMALYTGEYAKDKKIEASIDGMMQRLNYRVMPVNYFKLVVNKLDALFFNNELTIKTGDIQRDREVMDLVNKTGWVKGIRDAVRMCEIYGDVCLKTHKNGVSAFSPEFAYKVVDESNKDITRAYVLRELLYETVNDEKVANYVRVLVCGPGYDYERVFEYRGDYISGVLGDPVRYKYKNRWIPKSGRFYYSDLDVPTVQWISINKSGDGVYGESSFQDIKGIVFAIENRLSMDGFVIDSHGLPKLILGQEYFTTNNETGEYEMKQLHGQVLINQGGENKPEYLTWDAKLDASTENSEALMNKLYEISEMGKTFLTGEFQGNVSEESLKNIIKSAIDRGQRELNDMWYEMRSSLYVLCRLNGLEISMEGINIIFNIGRTDDDLTVSKIAESLSKNKILSIKTIREKYFGYDEDQADAEDDRILEEEGKFNGNTGKA